MKRLRALLLRSEFTIFATFLFAAMYFWPFVAFSRPVRVFRFVFVVWLLQIGLSFVRSVFGTDTGDNADRDDDAASQPEDEFLDAEVEPVSEMNPPPNIATSGAHAKLESKEKTGQVVRPSPELLTKGGAS